MGQWLHEAHHVPGTQAYRVTQAVVWGLVVVSMVALGLELTCKPVDPPFARFIQDLNSAVLVAFALELVAKVATFRPPDLDLFRGSRWWRLRTHVLGRLRYMLTPQVVLHLVIVLALVPALRGLRILRLLVLLRVFPYTNPFLSILRSFSESWLLYFSTLGALGLVVVLGGVALYLVEGRVNDRVVDLSDGIWWALVTITTVGYGDISPVTSAGRLVASSIMVVGMFNLALFAGIVTSTLLSVVVRLQMEQFRMSNHAHHVIICGYESGSHTLLDALLEEHQGKGRRELILFGLGGRPPDTPAEFTWVEGDPTRESQLDKVRPEHADAVVVVGRRSRPPQEADATTILTVFTLRRYLKSRPRARVRPVHVIAEILDGENVDHARSAGADEIMETTRLGFSMMAHSVVAPGSGVVLGAVASREAASIFVGELPSAAPPRYGPLARYMHEVFGITVLGLMEAGTGLIELTPAEDFPTRPDHAVIYLSDSPKLPELGPEPLQGLASMDLPIRFGTTGSIP